MKHYQKAYIHVIKTTETEKKKLDEEKVIEEIMAINFPNLKDTNLHIEENSKQDKLKENQTQTHCYQNAKNQKLF